MSCFITSGIDIGCSVGVGGIQEVWILGGPSGATVSTLAYDADGAITGATGNGTWYNFKLKTGTSSFTQNVQKNYENNTLIFEQIVNFIFYKYDQEKRNQVLALGKSDDTKVIVRDGNDVYTYLGQKNGLRVGSGTIGTGVAMTDRNGFEIPLQGFEPEPARTIVGDLATVFSGFSFA